jgi:ABC-type microcin C transport system permease subunit YejE
VTAWEYVEAKRVLTDADSGVEVRTLLIRSFSSLYRYFPTQWVNSTHCCTSLDLLNPHHTGPAPALQEQRAQLEELRALVEEMKVRKLLLLILLPLAPPLLLLILLLLIRRSRLTPPLLVLT